MPSINFAFFRGSAHGWRDGHGGETLPMRLFCLLMAQQLLRPQSRFLVVPCLLPLRFVLALSTLVLQLFLFLRLLALRALHGAAPESLRRRVAA